MARNDGGPAFSRLHQVIDANDPLFKVGHPGMSLRDYFAAKALNGLLTSGEACPWAVMAETAYRIADEMLKARERA